MEPRVKRSLNTLQAASKHVIYEFGMLQHTCEFSRRENVKEKKNAFLESWTIHARNLLDFFYSPTGPKKYPWPDDAIAEDFFDEVSIWRNARPNKSKALSSLGKRVGKEVAHLTCLRINGASIGPKWPNSTITNEIRKIVLKFYEIAPSACIGSEFKKYFKQHNPM